MSAVVSRDAKLLAWFARRGFAAAVFIALLLGLTTTLCGFFIDDYVHMLSIDGKVPMTTRFDLFCFASGEPGAVQANMGHIPYPWWTDLDIKLHFMRPLSSATMVLDHLLFRNEPLGYHLHSVLWYLLLVVAACGVLRRALPPHLAGIAMVLFALSFGHVFATVWWSNRNALIAAAPALFGLWAHLRWREDRWRPGLPLSLVGYAIGLAGGELALTVFGYLGAYELSGRRGPLAGRIMALVPGAALAIAYLLLYKLGDFGTNGSGVYIDPLESPAQFLAHAPERLVQLIGTFFFLIPVEVPAAIEAAYWPIVLLCVGATAFVGLLLMRAWPTVNDDTHRGLAWLAIGALFSCAPILSTFASARLLVVASLGGVAVLAMLLLHLRETAERGPLRLVFWGLLALHTVVSAVAWPAIALGLRRIDAVMMDSIARVDIDNTKAAEQVFVVPVAPDPMTALYTVIVREYHGHPRAQGWHVLSMAQCDHQVTRTSPDAIEVELLGGEVLDELFEQLMRDPEDRFTVGEEIQHPGFSVKILALGKRGPTRMRFTFEGNLDQPPYVFLGWQVDRLVQTAPPAVGESVFVPFSRGMLERDQLLFKKLN